MPAYPSHCVFIFSPPELEKSLRWGSRGCRDRMLGLRSLFEELLKPRTDRQNTAWETEVGGSSSEGRGRGDFTVGLLAGSLIPRQRGRDGKRGQQEVCPSMPFFDVNLTSPGEEALHLESVSLVVFRQHPQSGTCWCLSGGSGAGCSRYCGPSSCLVQILTLHSYREAPSIPSTPFPCPRQLSASGESL